MGFTLVIKRKFLTFIFAWALQQCSATALPGISVTLISTLLIIIKPRKSEHWLLNQCSDFRVF